MPTSRVASELSREDPHFHKKGRRCQQGPSPSYSDPLLCGCVVESTSCDSCSAGKPEIPPRLFLCLGFFGIQVVRSMILSDFRGPGAHCGSLATHFEDISDFCDFEDASGAKKESIFEVKMRPLTQFLQCWVLDVFLVLIRDFFDFGRPETRFGLPF